MAPAPSASHITRLLRRSDGEGNAAYRELFPLVYGQLRKIAQSLLDRERSGHTLQPTALVHEVFLKLVGQENARWEERAQFLSIAAQAMRRILLDHARTRKRGKRGGGADVLPLDGALQDALTVFEERAVDLIALDESLTKLAGLDARKAKLVELRFYAGLSPKEAADVMEVPLRTAERDWTLARTWLRARLADREEPDRADSGRDASSTEDEVL